MNNPKPLKVSFERHEVEDYERKRYRGWDQRLVDRRERKILGKILDEINEDSALVLDLPSGFGRFSELLLKRGYRLVSSDLSFHMVVRARERSRAYNHHSGVVADAKGGLPFKKEAFSGLLSMRLFHHISRKGEREFILKEFSAVTANWVILSYYQKTPLHLLQRIVRRKVKKTKRKISMIAGEELQKEVNRAGLRAVKIFPLFKGIHAHHIALLRKG